jgi:hypothetical protein
MAILCRAAKNSLRGTAAMNQSNVGTTTVPVFHRYFLFTAISYGLEQSST